jgi:hypothetical protein
VQYVEETGRMEATQDELVKWVAMCRALLSDVDRSIQHRVLRIVDISMVC